MDYSHLGGQNVRIDIVYNFIIYNMISCLFVPIIKPTLCLFTHGIPHLIKTAYSTDLAYCKSNSLMSKYVVCE